MMSVATNQTKVLLLAAFCLFMGGRSGYAQAGRHQDRSFIHYTGADGLPFASISDFLQDEHGFMWVGTRISVSRFDGSRFREYQLYDREGKSVTPILPHFFRNRITGRLYVHTLKNRIFVYREKEDCFRECYRLPGAEWVPSVAPSRGGGYWICQDSSATYLKGDFSEQIPLSEHFSFPVDQLTKRPVLAVTEHEGILYLLFTDNRLARINPITREVKTVELSISLGPNINDLFVDRDQSVWITTLDRGAFRLRLSGGKTDHFFEDATANFQLTNDMVRTIAQDREGNIWIGTENGLCIRNRRTGRMEKHRTDPNRANSLNSNAIYAIFCDRAGDVWVGTYFGGINLFSASKEPFNVMRGGVGDYALSGDPVSSITEDEAGNIYVGLEGDGFNIIDRATGKVEKFRRLPNRNSLSYDNVHDLLFGPNQNLYIGTYTGGLNIYDPQRDQFRYINRQTHPVLPSNNIYSLLGYGDSIFIGTDKGLVMHRVSDDRLLPFQEEVLGGKFISDLCRAGKQLWISGRKSLFCYDLVTGELKPFRRFKHRLNISFVSADEDGNVWIGDNFRGLYVYWKARDTVSHYAPASGFPAKRVYGMIPGRGQYYWISSSQGLIKFFPQTGNTVVYDRQSGLPFSQFNYLAFYKSRNKDIYFGGINGLIHFNEYEANRTKPLRKVTFTEFELFNNTIRQTDSSGLLSRPIHLGPAINLEYQENVFTVHYSALNYTHPNRIQYAYYLEGFENGWNLAGNRKSVTYTNLSPGSYTLHVKASYDNHEWTPASELRIKVAPPFYLSRLAFVIYGVLIVGGLVIFYLVSVKIEQSKSLAALERKEKETQERLNKIKLEFFTNISHDFRTPLTLIMGPLQQLLRNDQMERNAKNQLRQINRNAGRLLGLIDQLMDFRRVDQGRDPLRVRKGNVVTFVKEIKKAFLPLAGDRRIQLRDHYALEREDVFFDPQKLERILFNLLSNAFKFTPDGGAISLEVRTAHLARNGKEAAEHLQIKVMDTGKGIKAGQLERIFDRFHTLDIPDKMTNPGSGIGLAFVKSLVELHKGNIQVESTEGKGTCFDIHLPCGSISFSREEMGPTRPFYQQSTNWMHHKPSGNSTIAKAAECESDLTLLIAEDAPELLEFLRQCLSEKFRVITAANGLEALRSAQRHKPDLVISDIMMPEMDGLTLTRRLKGDVATSHIPVILLTARTEPQQHEEGFTAGADYYLEKPFYPQLLIKHVENILATRNRLISLFRKDLQLPVSEVTHSKPDQEFIEKLTKVIEEHIDHPDLGVGFLLQHLCISRSLLHLKLKKILDCSATEYIRSVRLKKAARLILEGGATIKEVAYATGFSSPSLFSRNFKQYFGKSPRDYAKSVDPSQLSISSGEQE